MPKSTLLTEQGVRWGDEAKDDDVGRKEKIMRTGCELEVQSLLILIEV